MWSKLKAMSILPKVLLGILLLGIIYKIGTVHHGRKLGPFPSPSYGEEGQTGRDSSGDSSQLLAEFQSQHAQLSSQAQQCEVQINQAMQGVAAAAANGQMVNNMPPCEQKMQMWTAQMAYLETEIYRLQTGDHRSSVREITGIPAGSSSSSSSPGSSGDGTEAVENYDRQAIRGTSLYTDESGEQHELPTRNYYFRDRSSGQIIASDQPNPPNDGRDYEQFTSAP